MVFLVYIVMILFGFCGVFMLLGGKYVKEKKEVEDLVDMIVW